MALRILFIPAFLLLVSCAGEHNPKSHGPIMLGDSSTIVTVNDPDLLRDEIPDLKPVFKEAGDTLSSSTSKDTITAQASPATTQALPQDGLVVPFKEITVNIPGIQTRSYGKPNLQKAYGASFELTAGRLEGSQLRLSGATVTAVSQRYQTMLMLKDGSDELLLESLPRKSSDWVPLKGTGGVYAITGLSQNELDYEMPSERALRNAVQHAARRARLNRRDTQDWLDAIRRLRSAKQPPAVVVLRAVMWRIEGSGFQKDLRMDVPLP
ncbi:MAG: hypothetical protein JST27_00630 [Bacteroidetes bacterium]|nr:hypothetical protein [Bacteroidota bacterium]